MRADLRNKIWIGAFFLMICGVQFLWPLLGEHLDRENYENRVAVERPQFSIETIDEFPASYEAYYNDHLPFRNQLIRFGSAVEYYAFRNSSNQNEIGRAHV